MSEAFNADALVSDRSLLCAIELNPGLSTTLQ